MNSEAGFFRVSRAETSPVDPPIVEVAYDADLVVTKPADSRKQLLQGFIIGLVSAIGSVD